MVDSPGSKKAAPPKEHIVASGKKLMWERGKHTWLALYWEEPVGHAGSGHVSVTHKAEAGESASQTDYHVPRVGIRVDKRAGSLENHTGETIRCVLV